MFCVFLCVGVEVCVHLCLCLCAGDYQCHMYLCFGLCVYVMNVLVFM